MEIFDYIVPILAVVFWILSSLFQKKNPEDEASPTLAPRPIAEADDLWRIQEEIRRVAQARKKASEQQSTATPPPLSTGAERRYELNKPYAEQRHPSDDYRQPQTPPPLRTEFEPTSIDYKAQIEQARSRAKAAKEHLEKTRSESIQRKASKQVYGKTQRQPKHDLHGSVTTMLQSKGSLRKAFLLKEILGAPVALRKG